MSSRSMGIISDRTEHDYFNDCNTNTSLIPMTSSLMNSLHRCSIKAQDASGQVLIGLINSFTPIRVPAGRKKLALVPVG
jgi:hypothetical protein